MIKYVSDLKNRAVFIRIEGTKPLIDRTIRHGFFALANDLKNEANREVLHGVKTGKVYIRRTKGGARRRHQASAPGETHANMTGALRRSLSWQVYGSRMMDFGYGIGKPLPDYAGAIEFGRRDGSIKARPTLANAIEANERNAVKHFEI